MGGRLGEGRQGSAVFKVSAPYGELYMLTQYAPSGVDAASKIRPTPADLNAIGPAFKQRWAQFFNTDAHADKPVYLMIPLSM